MNTDDAIASLARIRTLGTAENTTPEELHALTRGGRRKRESRIRSVRAASPTQVLMVGCGKMGAALLKTWATNPDFSFTAISPSGAINAPGVVRRGHGPDDIDGDAYDCLVLAVKPGQMEEALRTYRSKVAPDGLVVSMLAGVSCASLEGAGAVNPVRIMPNLAVAVGKGVTGVYSERALSPEQAQLLSDLMGPTGEVTYVGSEDQLDRLTAIAGSGPGYAFEIARCWAEAAETLGFTPDEARRLVLKTLDGSVHLALKQDKALGQLRKDVTSKNGTTAAGLAELNPRSRLDNAFSATVRAAYERAVELR